MARYNVYTAILEKMSERTKAGEDRKKEIKLNEIK